MEKILKIASWILMGLLLLPIIQQGTGIVHERKLRGSYKVAEMPSFSLKSWFNGEFQENIEPALNDRFGFRNLFIRINNQVAFSLYRKALASGVTIGKENYMYELNYILARNGDDYLGDSAIEANSRLLKKLQDQFEADGKHFLITFAAGKGSFYPEYFPDQHIKEPGKTNLQSYSANFDSLGVNYIDFNKWFLEMKDSSRYCLYPRTGVHWSYYGMVLVIDSLNNYLAQATGWEMPLFEYSNVRESRKYQSSDKDIEEGMNIIFRINYDKLAYPKVKFVDENMKKMKGVVIADSFYWGLHNIGFSSRIFDHGEYWYYNKTIIANHLQPIELDTIDRAERLLDKDILILMATEATLMKFPFGVEELVKSPFVPMD